LRKINQKEREEIFKDYYEQRSTTKFHLKNKIPTGLKTSQQFFKRNSLNNLMASNSEDTRASLIQETSEYLSELLGGGGNNQNQLQKSNTIKLAPLTNNE